MAKLYKIDGSIRNVKPKRGSYFSLEELQSFVGGYIETYPIEDGKRHAVFNENGLNERLPLNPKATREMAKGLNCEVKDLSPLVGDVLFMDNAEISHDLTVNLTKFEEHEPEEFRVALFPKDANDLTEIVEKLRKCDYAPRVEDGVVLFDAPEDSLYIHEQLYELIDWEQSSAEATISKIYGFDVEDESDDDDE